MYLRRHDDRAGECECQPEGQPPGGQFQSARQDRSHTKPESLLNSRIPMRTWADHDENIPGFVEIDLVGHEGARPV